MIGMALLVILAGAIISAVFVGRNLAESNIYQNTSFTVAQGYVEQIRSIEYVLLTNASDAYERNKSAVDAWSVIKNDAYLTNSIARKIMLETKSIDVSATGVASSIEMETSAPLYVGAWVGRNVLIDVRDIGEETQRELVMPMRFKVEMNNLSGSSDDVEALEITLIYQYQVKLRGTPKWYEKELRFVHCNAPTF